MTSPAPTYPSLLSQATDETLGDQALWMHLARQLKAQLPGDNPNFRKHVVTIHLEPQVYLIYAAIRLVVVTDAHSPPGFIHWVGNLPDHFSRWIKPCLQRSMSDGDVNASSLDYIRKSNITNTANGRVLTVPFFILPSMGQFGLLRTQDLVYTVDQNGRFPVIYNKTFPINSESHPYIRVTLEDSSTKPVHVPELNYRSPFRPVYPSRIHNNPNHNLHYFCWILPCHRSKKCCARLLPTNIIQNIGSWLSKDQYSAVACAIDIFNMALVSKSWYGAGITNFIWNSPAWYHSQISDSRLSSLASAMRKNRHIARHVTVYPQRMLSVRTGRPTSEPLSDVILGLAKNLQIISLQNFEFNLSRAKLSALRKIRVFKLLSYALNHFGTEVDRAAEFWDILETIQTWSALKELAAFRWNYTSGSSNKLENSASYQLHKLCLRFGTIDGACLEHLVSHPVQTLRHVEFLKVDGLTNQDLHNLFLAIGWALETLSIEKCIIGPPISPEQGFAFDLTVQNMPNLAMAFLQGDIISNLAIANKRGSTRPTAISIFDWSQESDFGGIYRGAIDLARAIELTGWEKIRLRVSRKSEEGLSKAARRDAREVALSRGIDLVII